MSWTCPSCGELINRDYNASKNIKEEGFRILSKELACQLGKFVVIRLHYPRSTQALDCVQFTYPFENQIFPEFIDIVPLVSILNTSPSIEDLDILYDTYINNQQRHVEGFIIIDNTFKNIQKYVRYKDGKATPHILK